MVLSTNAKINQAFNLSALVQIEVKAQLHALVLDRNRDPLRLLPAVMLKPPPSIEEVIRFSDECRDPADVVISLLDPEGQRQALRDSSVIISFIRAHESQLAQDLRDAAIALEAEHHAADSIDPAVITELEELVRDVAALAVGTYHGRRAVLDHCNTVSS